MKGGIIALFELALQGDEIRIADEKHYQLALASDLDQRAIRDYRD